MSAAPLVAFAGPVSLRSGGRQLHIAGIERGAAQALRVTIGGCESLELPMQLDDLLISSATPGHWQLLSGAQSFEVSGRALHVQRPAGAAFYQAVPGAPLTLRARAGWALLLNLLRLPGMARLLQILRSR
jgi:hypothetical protein